MTKIVLNKTDFVKALEIGGAFASKGKAMLPILDCVKMKIGGGKVVIVSSDNENAVSKVMDCIECEGEMTCCVNYKDLFAYVKLMNADTVCMVFEDSGNVCIEHKKGKMSIPYQGADEFPTINSEEYPVSFECPSALVNNWIVDGQQFVANDELRLVMNTIHFYHSEGKLGCCATDAHTLFWDKVDMDDVPDFEFNLNKGAFRAVCTALKDSDTVKVSVGDNNVKFKTSSCSVLARQISARFPNFMSVIPKNNNIEVKVQTKELIDAINRVKLGANNMTPKVKLAISGMNMEISCEDVDFNKKSVESMFVESTGDITIGLNALMFSKILSSIASESAIMTFSDSTRPVLLSEDNEESKKLFLQMPILLN